MTLKVREGTAGPVPEPDIYVKEEGADVMVVTWWYC